MRKLWPGIPFPPTFTFLPWLLGLIAAILVLALLTPVAFSAPAWMRPVAYLLAAIHVGNGLLHLIGSAIARRLVPGALSAPLLLITGAWLGFAATAPH
jgi:uncharacterized membrane protein AbrB (regulator of aidB expression)